MLFFEREQLAYTNCKKYVPIDSANPSKVIASEAKQSDAKHRTASSQSADSAEPIGRKLRAERLVAGSP